MVLCEPIFPNWRTIASAISFISASVLPAACWVILIASSKPFFRFDTSTPSDMFRLFLAINLLSFDTPPCNPEPHGTALQNLNNPQSNPFHSQSKFQLHSHHL